MPEDWSAAEPQDEQPEAEAEQRARQLRFKVACRLLRNSGSIAAQLPGQRRGESQIDYLVRIGVAVDKYAAAEALIVAKNKLRVLDETIEYFFNDEAAEI